MKVRPATPHERETLTGGDDGLVAEEGGAVVGSLAFNTRSGGFYVHSLVVMDPSGWATISLCQAVRKAAKALGYGTINFYVEQDLPALMRLAHSGRARLRALLLELDT